MIDRSFYGFIGRIVEIFPSLSSLRKSESWRGEILRILLKGVDFATLQCFLNPLQDVDSLVRFFGLFSRFRAESVIAKWHSTKGSQVFELLPSLKSDLSLEPVEPSIR